MWKCHVNIHVSGGIRSGIRFVKAFDRDKSLINHTSEYRVGQLITRGIKEKIAQLFAMILYQNMMRVIDLRLSL